VTAGALGDQPADDQSAGDQSAGDQSAGDQSAGDRAPGDRCGLVVDIGGTKVLAVLILDGEIVARTRLESRGLAAEVLASDVVSAAR
jgi:hypothetical protein